MTTTEIAEQSAKETEHGSVVPYEEIWIWGLVAYTLGLVSTFIYLVFATAGSIAAWWQWPLHILLSIILAYMWPLYWSLLQ